jgi:hypothetical protein
MTTRRRKTTKLKRRKEANGCAQSWFFDGQSPKATRSADL